MGRYGVDYVSVREAADALQAAGESVTVEKIRAALGSGSFTTLGKHLRTWRRAQDPTVGSAEAMPDMINDAAQAVWANLTQAAEARIAEAQAAAQTAVAAAQDAAQAQLDEVRQRQAEAGRLHAQALQHLQQRLDERTQELQDAQALQQATQTAQAEAARQAAEASAAQDQLQQRVEALEARLQAADERQQAAQTLAAETHRALEQEGTAHARALERLETAHAEAHARWQQQEATWLAQLRRDQEEADRLRAQLTPTQALADHLKSFEADSAQRHGSQAAAQAALAHQLEALQRALDSIQGEVRAVRQSTHEDVQRGLHREAQQAQAQLHRGLMEALAEVGRTQQAQAHPDKIRRS